MLLAHHLKQLKLPTVLREYDKVARECARNGVDHPRYLLRLIEPELIDRERFAVAQLEVLTSNQASTLIAELPKRTR